MADLLNLAMLIGGAVGSITFGILAAYAVLRTVFRLMRPQRQVVAVETRPEAARV